MRHARRPRHRPEPTLIQTTVSCGVQYVARWGDLKVSAPVYEGDDLGDPIPAGLWHVAQRMASRLSMVLLDPVLTVDLRGEETGGISWRVAPLTAHPADLAAAIEHLASDGLRFHVLALRCGDRSAHVRLALANGGVTAYVDGVRAALDESVEVAVGLICDAALRSPGRAPDAPVWP